jgi:ElaB/YqjD/DUF883 family membrane-anchored ribosome-binding protein
MSSITNTNIASYDYLLRNCYSSNRNARKSFGRATMNSTDLVQADANALKKAANNLKDLTYDSDSGTNIYNNIKAFVESYNNLLESSDKTSSAELTRAEKKLKNYIKANKDDLEELGVKVSSSGKLTLKESTLLSTSPSKVGKMFSSSNELTSTVSKYAAKIGRISKNMLRSGSSVNNQSENTVTDLPVTTDTMTATTIDYQA